MLNREKLQYQAGLEPTPVDPMTGIAYPIMPFEGDISTVETSVHHTAHARDRDELMVLENGQVIRTARMQVVYGPGGGVPVGGKLKDCHTPHQRYHYFFSGPEKLPANIDEQFVYGVWAGSMYVPEAGLDVSGKKMKLRKLNPRQAEYLHSGQIRVGAKGDLKMFLRGYVLDKGLQHVNESTVDQFMDTEEIDERITLGRFILSEASMAVTEALEPDFRRAHKKGRLSPFIGASAFSAVRSAVIRGNQEKIVRQIEKRLMPSNALQNRGDRLKLVG